MWLKNWNFGWKIVKTVKIVFHMTGRIGPAFFNLTERIEPFSIWLKDLILFSLTPRIEFFLNKTDRIGPFFLNMTQRIEFFLCFFTCLTELNFFQKWRRELNPFFFEDDAKNWTFFSLNVTSRIWTFFKKYDAKNWTLFQYDSKELNLLEYDSKKWTFILWISLKELNFFVNMTQRSELFFWTWLKEVNFFSKYHSKNWSFFSKWLKELNFSKCDSKNWTFFQLWLKHLNLFLNMIRRIELLSDIFDSKSKNRTSFFFNTTQRIEHLFFLHVTHVFIWFKELIFFFEKFLKELIFHMTQRMVPDAETWNLCFSKFDSKNWTFLWLADLKFFFQNYDAKNFLKNMTERIEPFFVWLKELNFFFWFAAKNWVFFLLNFDSKNWAIFLNSTQRIELFLYDLQNWTSSFLLIWFKELNLVSKKATQKIEIFFFKKMTHRIELFVNDS